MPEACDPKCFKSPAGKRMWSRPKAGFEVETNLKLSLMHISNLKYKMKKQNNKVKGNSDNKLLIAVIYRLYNLYRIKFVI